MAVVTSMVRGMPTRISIGAVVWVADPPVLDLMDVLEVPLVAGASNRGGAMQDEPAQEIRIRNNIWKILERGR